jgi:hypothetical protein
MTSGPPHVAALRATAWDQLSSVFVCSGVNFTETTWAFLVCAHATDVTLHVNDSASVQAIHLQNLLMACPFPEVGRGASGHSLDAGSSRNDLLNSITVGTVSAKNPLGVDSCILHADSML